MNEFTVFCEIAFLRGFFMVWNIDGTLICEHNWWVFQLNWMICSGRHYYRFIQSFLSFPLCFQFLFSLCTSTELNYDVSALHISTCALIAYFIFVFVELNWLQCLLRTLQNRSIQVSKSNDDLLHKASEKTKTTATTHCNYNCGEEEEEEEEKIKQPK